MIVKGQNVESKNTRDLYSKCVRITSQINLTVNGIDLAFFK